MPAPRRPSRISFPAQGRHLIRDERRRTAARLSTHMESVMIEIREVQGRYEVYSADRHWEVFDAKLAAEAVALALAAEIHQELGRLPTIISPWPVYPAMRSPSFPFACQSTHASRTGPVCNSLGRRPRPEQR